MRYALIERDFVVKLKSIDSYEPPTRRMQMLLHRPFMLVATVAGRRRLSSTPICPVGFHRQRRPSAGCRAAGSMAARPLASASEVRFDPAFDIPVTVPLS